MTRIAVPVSAASIPALLADSQRAQAAGADIVEWRVDTCFTKGLAAKEVIAAIPYSPVPVLITIRHASEGGTWSGNEVLRAGLYAQADAAGAAYIDVELAHHAILLATPKRAKLILSAHDFSGIHGGELAIRELIQEMRAVGVHLGCPVVAKVAMMARDGADLNLVRSVLVDRQGDSGELIILAMGEHGQPSRLLAGVWGSYLTFARLPDHVGSAPGQPTAEDLIQRYRVKHQRSNWRIFGVMGSPIAHSLSPHIHNAAFIELGIDAVYVPFRVENPLHFWQTCGHWISGLSITIPHKEALLKAQIASRVSPLAERVGVINTLVHMDHEVSASNTDLIAIQDCLAGHGGMGGRMVLCLGAGGVARAIVWACLDLGASVRVLNRTVANAERLCAEVRRDWHRPTEPDLASITWEQAGTLAYDVLINGTSVGMKAPADTPWPAERHRAGTVVFDTVYTPLHTRLLREAEAAGATTIPGLEMFILQAADQFRQFTDQEPHLDAWRTMLGNALNAKG